MKIDKALDVADCVGDETLAPLEQPGRRKMIAALHTLAREYRTTYDDLVQEQWHASVRSGVLVDLGRERDVAVEKAKAWETAAIDRGRQLNAAVEEREKFRADKDTWEKSAGHLARTCRSQVQELRRTNVELDVALAVWSDFREFLRTALNLDDDTLSGSDEVCQRVGELVKDSRLLARVRDEVNGRFVAGTMPAYDQLDQTQQEPWRVGLYPDFAVKIDPKHMVWVAPEGTDPHDMTKWTLLGTAYQSVIVEHRKPLPPKLANLSNLFEKISDTCAEDAPAPRRFAVGSSEPKDVKHVKRELSSVRFSRIGILPNGDGVWKRDDTTTEGVLRWEDVVRSLAAVEVL